MKNNTEFKRWMIVHLLTNLILILIFEFLIFKNLDKGWRSGVSIFLAGAISFLITYYDNKRFKQNKK